MSLPDNRLKTAPPVAPLDPPANHTPAPGTVPAVDPNPAPAPATPTPAPTPEPTNPEPAPADPPTPAPANPTPAPAPTPEPVVVPVNKIDVEQRYLHSSQEAIILNEQNKTLTGAITEAKNIPDPTEAELREYVKESGVEWDELSSFEKKMAKDTLKSQMGLRKITSVADKITEVDKWAKKVDEYVSNPNTKAAYPLLAGREREFTTFAMNKSHRGVTFDLLMPAFIQGIKIRNNQASMPIAATSTPVIPAAPKKELDAEEIALMRKNDPRRYKQLVQEGKINL